MVLVLFPDEYPMIVSPNELFLNVSLSNSVLGVFEMRRQYMANQKCRNCNVKRIGAINDT